MLNTKQKRAAHELLGNTILSASPGTGKTKTLVARAQKKLQTLPIHKSLALITYTNAAADEISSRITTNKAEIFIGTIHRFCLEFILRPFAWIYKWDKPRIITFDELKEFIKLNPNFNLGKNPLDEINKVKHLINGGLDTSVEWNGISSLVEVSESYFNYLSSIKAIDFNEILYKSYKIVSENSFVSTSLANKFYEISIDEFQDTNIFQYEILKSINSSKICTFFIVGDEKQKIFKFAGAIDNAFHKASLDFNAPIEILDITYRSIPNIVNCYSALFDNHPKLENHSVYKNENIKLSIEETKKATNNDIIDTKIQEYVQSLKVPLSEIAILTTSFFEALNISNSLRQKYHLVGLGALPHKSINSSTFALLKCLIKFELFPSITNLRNIRRNLEFYALENNIVRSEKEMIIVLNLLITRFRQIDSSILLIQGLREMKDLFDKVFDINNSGFEEIISNIKEEESKCWTLEKYFKTISGFKGITVNTIHQAKGLEYEIVFLNGVNENKIPYQKMFQNNGNWISEDLTHEGLENGKTLLYVGMSRAKSRLVILHNFKPSIFIQKIKEANS